MTGPGASHFVISHGVTIQVAWNIAPLQCTKQIFGIENRMIRDIERNHPYKKIIPIRNFLLRWLGEVRPSSAHSDLLYIQI